jgi:hypothetical protein
VVETVNTNVVQQLSDPAVLEGVAQSLLGDWIWLFVAGVAVLLFREIIQEFAAGLGVYFSRQWAVDEIVYLNGRQARIARIGMVETTFYMGDRAVELGFAGTVMKVRNTALRDITCEKILTNHVPSYLPKGGEGGAMKVELVEKKKPTPRKAAR